MLFNTLALISLLVMMMILHGVLSQVRMVPLIKMTTPVAVTLALERMRRLLVRFLILFFTIQLLLTVESAFKELHVGCL
jgi:hypothetical protein